MKKLLLLSLFVLSCTREIQTPNGKIKIDKSFNESVYSSEFQESYRETNNESCMKCGICYSILEGGFGFSCTCFGDKKVKYQKDVYTVIYQYSNGKETYQSVPKREIKNTVLEQGTCN